MLHLLPGLHCPGTAFFGVASALLQQLVTSPFVLIECQEVVEQLGEQAGIVGKIIEQTLDDTLYPHVQAVTLAFAAALPANRGAGDFVEQTARRVATPAEQPLVQ
ncbi:hypothetical protein D9M73_296860 [compost metagenome]